MLNRIFMYKHHSLHFMQKQPKLLTVENACNNKDKYPKRMARNLISAYLEKENMTIIDKWFKSLVVTYY